jgi:diguanylate cyclase (GGDEF)-like protein/PAS domain S-box-containing protein
MTAFITDLFRWRNRGPDRSGRIDHVFGTLTQADLEQQFRNWHWKDRRRMGRWVVQVLMAGVLAFILGDLAVHGWTSGTMVSTATRAAIILVSVVWIWLGARNRPPHVIDIATLCLAASIGGSLTIDFVVRGVPWNDLAMPALTSVVMFTLFLRQPLKFTLLGFAAQLLPLTVALIVKGGDSADISHAGLLAFGSALSIYYMRQIAIVSREYFLQNTQLEELASELDENMKTMALEHQTVQRAAEENAALADELALARISAEENSYYLENVLENIAQGVVVVDSEMRITKFNEQYKILAGVPQELAQPGTRLADIIRNALDRGLYVDSETQKMMKRAIETPGGLKVKGPAVLERAQGNGRYVEIRRNPLPDGGEVSTYTDITERKHAEEIIRAQALRDPLTDLSNRLHYTERLAQAIARSKRNDTYVALAYVDLDLFKPVNDTHGHAVGDAVLREVAATLRAHVREVDTVARLGGDEFAIVFDGIKVIADVRNPIDRIMRALSEPMMVGDLEVRIGVSVGIAFYPLDAESAEGLAKAADEALYNAKQSGRGCWKLSQPEYEVELPAAHAGGDEARLH